MRKATPSSFSSVLGDKNAAYPKAIADLKAAGKLSESVEPRQIKYLNNLVEQDHRFIKRLVKPGMGFFSVGSACMTLQGYERMNMIRKGQMDGPRFLCGTRKPIQTITTEEFERLLLTCAPPNEIGTFADRAAVRNRAILWLLYDTGIRASELINLRLSDVDRKKGVVTVMGKGSKERHIALGQNCLRNLAYYLDKHRPDVVELAEWGSAGEDHLFLSETREPLTKNGMEMLFKRLRTRAGIVGKRISPHILRHTFAMNYLIKSNDPFSLQELLGHEDLTTVLNYIHMNDTILQEQKRKYSPGDHLPARMPGPRETRRQNQPGKERRS